MAEYVGNKNEIYRSELPALGKYPALAVSEFQSLFHFQSNETEAGILHHAKVSRLKVHSELKDTLAPFADLAALSQARFDDTESGETLYKQAVFALTAAQLISTQMSGDASKDAAERQEALTDKKEECEVQYRQAVDMLIHGEETYCFERV
ncbi:MAG: head completion/stabilization protein [Vibrio sp.]|uniref:head completion/stabilization protein n=1 Tax=Vibrio sp. TaxID=678 RepID=UPI001EC1FCE5|nr:head completion/stabilization protein [Vibrio sp.]NRB68750.1 head completion/stabilization protein [Vibrio sp.]